MSIDSPLWQPPEYNEDDFDKVRHRLWLRVRANLRALQDETLKLTLENLKLEDVSAYIAFDEEQEADELVLFPRITYIQYEKSEEIIFPDEDDDTDEIEDHLPMDTTLEILNTFVPALQRTLADIMIRDFIDSYVADLKDEFELCGNPRADDEPAMRREVLWICGDQLRALHAQISTGTLK